MIEVRWMTRNEPWNKMGTHGLDFKDCNDRSNFRGLNWKEYVMMCAEAPNTIFRVWVNGEMVWLIDKDWLVDINNYVPK